MFVNEGFLIPALRFNSNGEIPGSYLIGMMLCKMLCNHTRIGEKDDSLDYYSRKRRQLYT